MYKVQCDIKNTPGIICKNRRTSACHNCYNNLYSNFLEAESIRPNNYEPITEEEMTEIQAQKNCNNFMKIMDNITQAATKAGITNEQALKFMDALYENKEDN